MHWPTTRITFRGDSHYGRPEAMAWCEANRIDYIFGLAGNSVLRRQVYEAGDAFKVLRAEQGAAKLRGLPSSGATSFVDALIEGLRQAAREARDLHRGHVDVAELQLEIAIEIDIVNAHMTARTELDS